MKKLLLAMAVVVAALMSSCGGAKVEMDNPTDYEITVKIDGKKEYVVAPKELIAVTGLKKGDHTMSVDGGPDIPFTFDGEYGAMLNPTLSLYVTDVTEYSEISGNMDSSNWVTVEIDGDEYFGPIRVYENQPIISFKGIHYGVLQDFPEEVDIRKSGSVFHTKLFRKGDFFKYYDEAYF